MAGSTATRLARPRRRGRFRISGLILAALVAGGAGFAVLPGAAQFDNNPQWVGVRPLAPPRPGASAALGGARDPNAQMLLRADELQYDNANNRVIAHGDVQIYYKGSSLQANRVIYNQRSKRLNAEGNVRLVEPDGKIITAQILDLDEDFRDGFVDSFRLEGADQTRFAAPRAERSKGTFTTFQSGVYTACLPCKEDPRRPPLWQVKSTRIIHDEAEKMIYFERGSLEFFGVPVFYFPYLSAPDPTVRRKTGVLMPRFMYSSIMGFGVEVPYFWALAPDYDITVAPRAMTRQGLLIDTEWRQRLINGAYSIRAAGILQADKDYFLKNGGPNSPGYRDFRGSLDTTGQFSLNNNWVWGFDATLLTDKTFLQDYGLRSYYMLMDPFKTGGLETVSQLYLTGRGDRSFFDARVVHYFGLSPVDVQSQLPVVHPLIDYRNVLGKPILGGELSYRVNLTSLSRDVADFDPITQKAIASNQCDVLTADPAIKSRADCILRGMPGTYSRLSAETTWRRTLIDPYGQMFTPFASLRADVAALSTSMETGVANFLPAGDSTVGRVMPVVGLEYRYPFISAQSWGTQIVEPIAQLIIRPNESAVGRLPNEDAQSMIFDDVNLLAVNKFAGWDRLEGGSRLNAAVHYTAQFNRGGFVNVLFGQSYQLFGQNSFALADTVNTGINSGLETARSDYVGRIAYHPDNIYAFISRFRLDEHTMDVRRFEVEARANFSRWSVAILYGNYDAQPEIGFLARRQGILASGTVKFTQNWSVLGAARFNLETKNIDQYRIGLGYIDDCFAISINYITDYTYSSSITKDTKVMLQINLRTLGGTSFSQSLSSQGANAQSLGSTLGL
jgi:LPS-assembly protein